MRYALTVLEKERELAASDLQRHPLTFCANWTVVTQETELGLQRLDAYACLRLETALRPTGPKPIDREGLEGFESLSARALHDLIRTEVAVAHRTHQGRAFSRVFLGCDAVDALEAKVFRSRATAVRAMQVLVDHDLCYHVLHPEPFQVCRSPCPSRRQ